MIRVGGEGCFGERQRPEGDLVNRAKYDARRAQLYELATRYSTIEDLIASHQAASQQPGLPIKAARWHERKTHSLNKQLRRALQAAKQVTA
jgi:hypothetical protein